MAYDLTLTSATFDPAGKFGSSLIAGGYGQTNDLTLGLTEMTLEAWIKTTVSGSSGVRCIAGGGGNPWLNVQSGLARACWGSGVSTAITGGPAINDGVWHHVALCLSTTTGGTLWVDGVQVASAAAGAGVAPIAGVFGVGRFGSSTGFDWVNGQIDEVAVSSVIKYTAPFTPGPVSNTQTGLRAVYHLDGNGLNSAGLAAPADATKPTASSAAVANSTPAVVAITMSEAMDPAFIPAASAFVVGGHTVSSVAISGTVINLTCSAAFVNGEAARTVSYTQPATGGARDIAGNLLDTFVTPLAITNNVADTVAPAFASAQVTNSQPAVILVTMNEALAASIPPNSAFTPSGGRTVTGVTISGTVASITVNTPYTNGDTITIAYTQPAANPRLQDAAGNPTATFAAQPVTNNISAAGDTIAPAFSSAQVTNSQPSVILVTMNETLAASVPPVSAFAASGGRTVTAVTISGAVASVTVNTPYAFGDVITIAYTQPTTNPRLQDATGNPTATFAAQPVTNNVAAVTATLDTTKILFSPYNWDVQSGSAKTINAGAYFKTCFGGATCTLAFDMTGILSPVPKISYRVDATGPWVTVDLAASIAISMPAETTTYPSHYLEVLVRATSEANSRWVSQATAVKLTGVTLAAGKVLALPPAQPRFGLYYGDSITEGINTLKNTGDATVRSDAGQSWAYLSAQMIGAECGVVGFGRQGFISTGNPDVPVFQNTWNLLYQGVSRSFTRPPDYIVINQGTNDNGGNIQVAATNVLNGMIAATPASTKIIVLRPFNGASDAFWTTAIANCTAPSRVTHVDTTGWFNTVNSPDALHPNGFENETHIAPLMAAKLREVLDGLAYVAPTPTPVTGTSTFTTDEMATSNTLRKNQACQWTWFAGGSIGSTAGSPVHGSGTLTAGAKLVATGLPAGPGYIVVRFADGGRFYQDGTAA